MMYDAACIRKLSVFYWWYFYSWTYCLCTVYIITFYTCKRKCLEQNHLVIQEQHMRTDALTSVISIFLNFYHLYHSSISFIHAIYNLQGSWILTPLLPLYITDLLSA